MAEDIYLREEYTYHRSITDFRLPSTEKDVRNPVQEGVHQNTPWASAEEGMSMHVKAIKVVAARIKTGVIVIDDSVFDWGNENTSAILFIQNLCKKTRFSPACVVMAYEYLCRLKNVKEKRLKEGEQKKRKLDDPEEKTPKRDSLQRLFAVLLRIANKMIDELTVKTITWSHPKGKPDSLKNSEWSKLLQFANEDEQTTLKKFNALEMQVYHVLKWNVHVDADDVDVLTKELLGIA
jgi:hypothetical protein